MQVLDDDTQQEEYEDYQAETRDPGRTRGRAFWAIAAYFLLMSFGMWPAQQLHLGMMGVLASMIGAGIVLGLILLIILWIRRKMRRAGLTKWQWLEVMSGYHRP